MSFELIFAKIPGKEDPRAYALEIRKTFEQCEKAHARAGNAVPAWHDPRGGLNAYAAIEIVQRGTGCDANEAAEAVEETMPELYADFWLQAWRDQPKEAQCLLA